jgi:hypothetical protein
MARITEQDLQRALKSAAGAADYLEKEGGDPEDLRNLVAEVRRLRAILDRVYSSCTARDEELDAEVREIRQEKAARAASEKPPG